MLPTLPTCTRTCWGGERKSERERDTEEIILQRSWALCSFEKLVVLGKKIIGQKLRGAVPSELRMQCVNNNDKTST